MPTFNSEATIRETIDSILAQTYEDWELLITDDASSDNTVDVIKKTYGYDGRIKVYSNELNGGAAEARNNSIKMASGDFVAFLDSDDLWKPDKLQSQIDFMENNLDLNGNRINFSFTAFEIIDADGKSKNKIVDGTHSGLFTYEDMLKKKATLGCSTVMLRRAAFPTLEMPKLRTGQDYALWLRLLRGGNNAFIINTPLTKYRILPNSISRNKVKKAMRQWQIYRAVEHLSFYRSIESFFFYSWRAVFRK